MATQRKPHPIARLLEALEAEDIRYILVGMSAAIVQGVMGTTLDADFWINLPAREYMRVQNIARKLGGTVGANTVVYASDGTPLNFIFGRLAGLSSFERELKHTRKIPFRGKKISVLKLERILKSKETLRRDKDLLHIIQIRELLRCQRALNAKTKSARKQTKQ